MGERFIYEYSEETSMILIKDTFREEPNTNSICNPKGIVRWLNELNNENERLRNTINVQTMALCDFHNRELAQEKWGEHRPEFDLDTYYEICMNKLKKEME